MFCGIILVLGHGISIAQAIGDIPQQIAEHSRRAEEFLREKKPDLAIPELQAVVALDPNDQDTRANLGVLLFFQGDFAQAVPQLRAAFQLKPDL